MDSNEQWSAVQDFIWLFVVQYHIDDEPCAKNILKE